MLTMAFARAALPKSGALALLVAEEEALSGIAKTLDEASAGGVTRALEAAAFKGQKAKTCLLFSPAAGFTRVVFIGLGKRAEVTASVAENATESADRAGIRISSKLLQLAKRVVPNPGARPGS